MDSTCTSDEPVDLMMAVPRKFLKLNVPRDLPSCSSFWPVEPQVKASESSGDLHLDMGSPGVLVKIAHEYLVFSSSRIGLRKLPVSLQIFNSGLCRVENRFRLLLRQVF